MNHALVRVLGAAWLVAMTFGSTVVLLAATGGLFG